MKIRSFAPLLLLALPLTAQPTQAPPQAAPSPQTVVHRTGVAPHAGMDAIYATMRRGYEALDPDVVATAYTEDALYLPSRGDMQRGRAAIREYFAGNFKQVRQDGARLRLTFEIVERRISGDLAADVGYYTLVGSKDGEEGPPSRGKFMTVSVKDKDGVWRFHVDGDTPLPPPGQGQGQQKPAPAPPAGAS